MSSEGEEAQPASGLFQSVYLPVRLVCISGSLQDQSFANWGEQLVFGREFSNDVVLPEDTTSKVHARITCKNGVYFLEDLNSNNGTYLQGRKIDREKLQSGHVLRIGTTSFRFETVTPQDDIQPRTWIIASVAIALAIILSLIVSAAIKGW